MLYSSAEEMIGNTPLVRLTNIEVHEGLTAHLYAKLECANPAGSAKDRAALLMIEDAEKSGMLPPGGTVIEPTSGNTGIGLAFVAALRGYRAIIVMPDSMSPERIKLMRAYGADVVLTPGKEGMTGAIAKAETLKKEIPGSIIAGQFDNPANPAAHYRTTGPEIWADLSGQVDAFVAGVGTGGTISGVGRYLKEQNPSVRVIAVEPADSPLLSGGKAGPHPLQGIGANFIPKALDTSVYDTVITVTGPQAYDASRMLARTEGLLVGISSGAALHAAMMEAGKPENSGKNIVVLLPDGGSRYLSTDLFE